MRIIFTLIIISFSTTIYGQNGQELDKRNGFKDIKLLTDVRSYPGLSYSKDLKYKPDHAVYVAKKGSYESIGEVKIFKLTVYSYRNQIYKIGVVTEKNEKLFRSLERSFGKINTSIATRHAYWSGDKVRLNYDVENAKKIKLTYVSKEIKKIIAQDKKKAVDSLATEF